MTQSTQRPATIYVGVKMPPVLANAIRQDAQRTGSTMSDVVRLAVAAALNVTPPQEVPG